MIKSLKNIRNGKWVKYHSFIAMINPVTMIGNKNAISCYTDIQTDNINNRKCFVARVRFK